MNVRVLTTIAAVLAVVAFGYAAWAGVSWYSATHGESTDFARQRDEALLAGQVSLTNFTNFDYKAVDKDIERWLASSTGKLHDEAEKSRESTKKKLQDAKTVTVSRVLDAAVTELDDRAGKAKVIAVMESTATPEGGKPSKTVERYLTELTRTDDGWKLSLLAPVK